MGQLQVTQVRGVGEHRMGPGLDRLETELGEELRQVADPSFGDPLRGARRWPAG